MSARNGPPDKRRGRPAKDAPTDSLAAAKPLALSTAVVPTQNLVEDVAHAWTGAHVENNARHARARLGVHDVAKAERLAWAERNWRELVAALHGDDTADLSGWLVDKDAGGEPVYPHPVGFHVLDALSDEVREVLLWQDAAEHKVDALADPDLWHGLDGREDEVEVWTRRVGALGALRDGARGKPLAPCFDPRDLKVDLHGQALGRADAARLPVLSEHLSQHHDKHWYWSSPFCWGCWGRPLAEARLQRWLLLNGGRTPQVEMPEEVPGDALALVEEEVAEADAYLDLGALMNMPEPVMLVDGLAPQNAYGLITGRDGTGKSLLALDLALHVVTGKRWYGDRVVDLANYGRALYLVGEGAQYFGLRVRGWMTEHGVDPATVSGDDLVFRNGTVDLYGGGEAFDALLARVGDMEPDLIVFDTLARSSGAGESNSATDMSIVRSRIDAVRLASNGGTVLVVAHTTKGDTDARGSSVIEDDADFVLHADLKDGTQHVKVAKQKDGPSGQTVALYLAQVEVGGGGATTRVLREPGKGGTPLVSPEDSTKNRILGVLLEQRSLDPKTQADLVATLKELGREVTRQAVSKALGVLVEEGSVVKAQLGSTTRYSIAPHRIPKDMR